MDRAMPPDYRGFFCPGPEPLAEKPRPFLGRVRCFTFQNVRDYLHPYYLQTFPPTSPKRAGWNSNCDKATQQRLKSLTADETLIELHGLDYNRLPGIYAGYYLDSRMSPDVLCHIDDIALAVEHDCESVRKQEMHEDRPFYAFPAFKNITLTAYGEDGRGRSEFISGQTTLSAFYIALCQSCEPRHQQWAESWRLLEIPTEFEAYRQNYHGDATVQDGHETLTILSPAYHWWNFDILKTSLERLLQRISGPYILLSPHGFKRWDQNASTGPLHVTQNRFHSLGVKIPLASGGRVSI